MLMYSFIRATLLWTIYVASMAIFGRVLHFLYNGKTFCCVTLGCILGAFIGAPLFSSSNTAGFVGIGIGIALMFILFYSGIVGAIIRLIPEKFKQVVGIIFNVLKYAVITIVIIGVVVIAMSIFVGF